MHRSLQLVQSFPLHNDRGLVSPKRYWPKWQKGYCRVTKHNRFEFAFCGRCEWFLSQMANIKISLRRLSTTSNPTQLNGMLFWQKFIAGSAFMFLAFLTIQCPCQRLLCCHLGTFWIGLSVALGVVFYENGIKIIDKSCW